MKVYCQNFERHSPGWRNKEFKIFGQTLPRINPQPVECYEVGISFSEVKAWFCPVCKERVELGPEQFASWGPIESRAGYPKSMIRKM